MRRGTSLGGSTAAPTAQAASRDLQAYTAKRMAQINRARELREQNKLASEADGWRDPNPSKQQASAAPAPEWFTSLSEHTEQPLADEYSSRESHSASRARPLVRKMPWEIQQPPAVSSTSTNGISSRRHVTDAPDYSRAAKKSDPFDAETGSGNGSRAHRPMQGLLYEDGGDVRRGKSNTNPAAMDDDFASSHHDFVDQKRRGNVRETSGVSYSDAYQARPRQGGPGGQSLGHGQGQGRDRQALNKVDGNRPPWSDDFIDAPSIDSSSRPAPDSSLQKSEARRKSGVGSTAAPKRESRPAWDNEFVSAPGIGGGEDAGPVVARRGEDLGVKKATAASTYVSGGGGGGYRDADNGDSGRPTRASTSEAQDRLALLKKKRLQSREGAARPHDRVQSAPLQNGVVARGNFDSGYGDDPSVRSGPLPAPTPFFSEPPEQAPPQELIECDGCSRRFNAVAFQKHSQICANVFQNKRKQYDMSAQRIAGIAVENEASKSVLNKAPVPAPAPVRQPASRRQVDAEQPPPKGRGVTGTTTGSGGGSMGGESGGLTRKSSFNSNSGSGVATLTTTASHSNATHTARSQPTQSRNQPQPPPQRPSSFQPKYDDEDSGMDHENVVAKATGKPEVPIEALVAPTDIQLIPCQTCGRNFNPDSLQKHSKICQKVFIAKRKEFNMTEKRTADLDDLPIVKKKEPKGRQSMGGAGAGSNTSAAANSHNNQAVGAAEKKKKWQIEHEQFQAALKAARQYQKAKDSGMDMTKFVSTTVIPSAPDDRIPCPHCGRSFGETAAERHIPKCKDTVNKPRAIGAPASGAARSGRQSMNTLSTQYGRVAPTPQYSSAPPPRKR